MIGECWQVDRWNKTPQKITIVKETEDTFTTAKKDWQGTMREWKSMKASTNIFATWDAAKAWMIEQAEESLEYAKREVDRKRSELETIKQLHESRLGRGGARLGRRGVPLPEVGAERARGRGGARLGRRGVPLPEVGAERARGRDGARPKEDRA